jgi:pilus assembly protein CpaE
MSNVLRLALVDPNDDSREELKSILHGLEMVWLEAECSRYEFFPDVVGQSNPDIGLIVLDSDIEKSIALLDRLREESHGCETIALSSSTDGQLILRCIRAGAREYLTLPLDVEELMASLDQIAQRKYSGTEGKLRSSKIIAFCGASGGVGCTSLAVNLGCILASNPNNSAALVDLDLAIGDADVFLDTIPDYSLVDVTQNIARLDFQLLKRSMTKHPSGLYLLPRPVQLQDLSLINPESLRRVFGLLKASFTHVILDLSKGFTEVDVAALEMANEIVMVIQLDLPSLRNLVRLLSSFDEIAEIRDKVKIIVNRAGLESGQISLKKARETIGREIFSQIPNDYRTMVEVRNNGIPLIQHAPQAAITTAMVDLAERISGQHIATTDVKEEQKQVAPSSNWLSFWPGKGGKPTATKSK